ncbi:MAG: IS66 family transposase [Herminiimonas sp.]|nr:IS66 family transposase [Herminiimonas sp.]
MKQPKLVDATQEELDALLTLARAASFPQHQLELLEGVLGTFVYVMQSLQNAKMTLTRFRHRLFGKRTENRAAIKKQIGCDAGSATDQAERAVAAAANEPVPQTQVQMRAADSTEGKKRKGHGRNGADMYRGAGVVACIHPNVQPGAPCPACEVGKLYLAEPRTIVKMSGQLPIGAIVYKLDNWRCRLCEAIFTAPMPDGVDARKYDESCASMIAMLRYGNGMPFHRLEGLQACLGVPLPDATQWDIVDRAATGPRHVFGEMIRQAAQAEVLHNDDTPARILDLMGCRRAKAEAAGGEMSKTKAINTSGIVALMGTQKVMLFFTGPAHAGRNLAQVLAHRATELAPPIQMCDALSANVKGDFETILSHCIAHGRRKFVEVAVHFPAPCLRVIEDLATVYRHDAHCKDQKMPDAQRLDYHQDRSGPLLLRLKIWMLRQLEQRQVEPNSGLGEALRYMLKHWKTLTLFLRKAGAPLDNNICERCLKKAIIHRKNSLFYRSQHGAEVGDIYMSLIYTCQSCGANPFAYLQTLQKHVKAVASMPQQWLPWNYQSALSCAA